VLWRWWQVDGVSVFLEGFGPAEKHRQYDL
jgi:hypothetical protein